MTFTYIYQEDLYEEIHVKSISKYFMDHFMSKDDNDCLYMSVTINTPYDTGTYV